MSQEKTKDNVLYDFYGKPPRVGQMIPLTLQHVLAAIVGIITPAIIVAGACGLNEADTTLMIQASLVMTALATLLQLFPLFGRIGSGLPVIMGSSFAYVPTLEAMGVEYGLSTILGAQIVGGVVALLFGIFVKWIRKLFPDFVTGTVIFTIGLSLYPTAIRYMAGGAGSENFGSVKNWAVATVTFVIVFVLSHFAKGILKQGSLFFGMVAGYLMALAMGMVDFSGLSTVSEVVSLPKIGHFPISFVPAACVSLAVVYIVNGVQTIGDLSSATMGGMDRVPTDKELSGGILTQGVMSILASFVGGLPTASYSQNVGIVTVNKVINRFIFLAAALILLAAGLIPGLSAALTTIPQSVIGGATISVFAIIAMTGVHMITRDGFDNRKSTIVGLSVALGVGITQVSGSLAGPGMPEWFPTVFGSSPVVVSAIMAVLLNLIMPKNDTPAKEEPAEEEGKLHEKSENN